MPRRPTRRRSRTEMAATGQRQDLTAAEVDELFHVCCASTAAHRFDCPAVAPEKRGRGSFGPIAPATPRQLVDLIRRSSIGAGLADIETRGIAAHLADLEHELHPHSGR